METKFLCFVTKEEKDSMVLINTKLGCAEQALKLIPFGMNDDESKNYVKGCIDALGEYRWLEKDWWDSIIEKYDLPRDKAVNISLDFDTGELYL